MALSGTVFIDRTNRKSAIAAFDGAICEIRDNKQSVWIFPEGTRSHFPAADLLPFKKGAFHLAIQAGVPIVPVVVANYSHVLHVRDRTFEQGLIKIKVCLHSEPERQQANMAGEKVLQPIDTRGMTSADVDELVTNTRDDMLSELKLISVRGVDAKKTS